MNWMIIAPHVQLSDENIHQLYEPELINIANKKSEKVELLQTINEDSTLHISVGPCASSLDQTLKNLGVDRQAYHGKSFIGNHCHKMLKVIKL